MASNPLAPIYEILAKELAYVFDNPAFATQIATGLALAGYTKDQEFVDPTTGFQAIGLTSTTPGKAPVLVIRGTDQLIDDAANSDPNGIGANQFAANKAAIDAWLTKVSTATVKPDIVGHSMGGALAQLTAAEFTSKIGNVFTFDSPGVNTATATKFQQAGGDAQKVTHYIVQGDLVSLAGQSFIPGSVILQSFTDPAIDPIEVLDKHNVPKLLTTPPVGYKETPLTVQQLSDPTFNFNSDSDYAEFLAAYKAVQPKIEPSLLSRKALEDLRVKPGTSFVGLIQQARTDLAPDKDNLLVGDAAANTADGAGGKDTIVGNGGDDVLRGGVGGDRINGDAGKDSLFGDAGRDILTGGIDNDILTGGDNNDMLIGVNVSDRLPGRGEIDTYTGGKGKDLFELGNKKTAFYEDGRRSKPGVKDYGLITDLNRGEGDKIQLNGKLSDYVFKATTSGTTSGLPKGIGIYLKSTGAEELIGIAGDVSKIGVVKDVLKFV